MGVCDVPSEYTFAEACPLYGGLLRTWCELFYSRKRNIISLFHEIISHFREIITRFCEILSRFREIISRFREIISHFREILFRFSRDIISLSRYIISLSRNNISLSRYSMKIYLFYIGGSGSARVACWTSDHWVVAQQCAKRNNETT